MDKEKFSQRLKHLRENRGITQKEFASELGVKRSTVGSWETAHRWPEIQKAQAIADYFNVRLGYLIGTDDDSIPPQTKQETLNYEAMVFDKAKTFAEAIEISVNVRVQYNLSKEWLHALWAKATKRYPIEDVDIIDEPAHGLNQPGSGISD